MDERIYAREQEEGEDVLNLEKNHRLFLELPSTEIQLFATHLTRMDAFLRILITGRVTSSKELAEKLSKEFTKTHRGYYLRQNDSIDGQTTNDYISLNAGLPRELYTKVNPNSTETVAGFGFIIPLERVLASSYVGVDVESGGQFFSSQSELDDFVKSDKYEPGLETAVKFLQEYPIANYIPRALLKDVLTIARKSGKLTDENQPEIHLRITEEGEVPQLLLSETIILCPETLKPEIIKSLTVQLEEMQPYAQQIQDMFSVNVRSLSPQEILERDNIYWYPQPTILGAVEYLSTHPEAIT